jgi:hypothetical protein
MIQTRRSQLSRENGVPQTPRISVVRLFRKRMNMLGPC